MFIGTYNVEIYAKFALPYDYINARSAAFTLTVTDPCVTSITQNLRAMYIHATDSSTDTQSFTEYISEA